jgi:para-nitrobenzyl esterase
MDMVTNTKATTFIIGLFLISFIFPVRSETDTHTVTTPLGSLKGAPVAEQVTAFLGIRYGADTSGDNRWRPPQPAPSWDGMQDATAFGSNCLQLDPPSRASPWGAEFMPSGDMSEDCLFLNIWAPSSTSNESLPVLVWIHGGAFIGGSGSIDIYNGAALAEEGIIVVTINYRLGILGFMGHPELTTSNGYSGQYGLLDQVAALKWVSTNIAAFGGDPSRVTIAGQSAGAASVHTLLTHPAAGKLFQQAISQSGTGMGVNYPTTERAEQLGSKVQKVLGATDLSAMRKLPGKDILQAVLSPALDVPMAIMQFRPVVSGEFSSNTTHKDLPLLSGFTGNESSLLLTDWEVNTPAALHTLLEGNLGKGDATEKLYRLYLQEHPVPVDAGLAFLGDRALMSMSEWVKSTRSSEQVYAYQFAVVPPGPPEGFGSFHTSEVPYVFGNLAAGERQYRDEDRALSSKLKTLWSQFVKTGNPNAERAKAVAWKPLAKGKMLLIDKDHAIKSIDFIDAEKQTLFLQQVATGGTLGMFNNAGR